jgi:hypothetical protein
LIPIISGCAIDDVDDDLHQKHKQINKDGGGARIVVLGIERILHRVEQPQGMRQIIPEHEHEDGVEDGRRFHGVISKGATGVVGESLSQHEGAKDEVHDAAGELKHCGTHEGRLLPLSQPTHEAVRKGWGEGEALVDAGEDGDGAASHDGDGHRFEPGPDVVIAVLEVLAGRKVAIGCWKGKSRSQRGPGWKGSRGKGPERLQECGLTKL